MSYPQVFLTMVDHVMLYEVGGWWDANADGAQDGTNAKACGYTNDPDDPGGETKYGISKNENPNVDVGNLDWAGAQDIYYNHYWLTGHCDKLPGKVAAFHFDGCINPGIGGASRFLQQAVGVTVDGSIGNQTIQAVNNMDPVDVCTKIKNERIEHYQDIVNGNASMSRYLSGWLRRVNETYDFVTNSTNNF